jgi:hypothetical protein
MDKVTSCLGFTPPENRLAAAGAGGDTVSRTNKAMETNRLDRMKFNPWALVARFMGANLVWGCIVGNDVFSGFGFFL